MFKILIVEDEEKIRVELQNLLNRYGYEALTLSDFHEVDQQILRIQPHLVLLDINLPEMDGYMICRSLRQQSSIPILMVTSRSSDLDELMSMSSGADDFITKPYNVQILLAHIRGSFKACLSAGSGTAVRGQRRDAGFKQGLRDARKSKRGADEKRNSNPVAVDAQAGHDRQPRRNHD